MRRALPALLALAACDPCPSFDAIAIDDPIGLGQRDIGGLTLSEAVRDVVDQFARATDLDGVCLDTIVIAREDTPTLRPHTAVLVDPADNLEAFHRTMDLLCDAADARLGLTAAHPDVFPTREVFHEACRRLPSWDRALLDLDARCETGQIPATDHVLGELLFTRRGDPTPVADAPLVVDVATQALTAEQAALLLPARTAVDDTTQIRSVAGQATWDGVTWFLFVDRSIDSWFPHAFELVGFDADDATVVAHHTIDDLDLRIVSPFFPDVHLADGDGPPVVITAYPPHQVWTPGPTPDAPLEVPDVDVPDGWLVVGARQAASTLWVLVATLSDPPNLRVAAVLALRPGAEAEVFPLPPDVSIGTGTTAWREVDEDGVTFVGELRQPDRQRAYHLDRATGRFTVVTEVHPPALGRATLTLADRQVVPVTLGGDAGTHTWWLSPDATGEALDLLTPTCTGLQRRVQAVLASGDALVTLELLPDGTLQRVTRTLPDDTR
ncbi:MAG: hypothetical protein H6733_06130 [Alphaproteobacteria bacterium]|nr:hypothetical protein [Alphaproteobacteria bacterium]